MADSRYNRNPFNLLLFFISFSIFIYPGDPAETCVTNINHQSSNDGKICLAHVTRSIIRGGGDGDGGGVVVINEYRKWLFFPFFPLYYPSSEGPDHALKTPPWGKSGRRVAGGTRGGGRRRRRINKNPLARLVDVLLYTRVARIFHAGYTRHLSALPPLFPRYTRSDYYILYNTRACARTRCIHSTHTLYATGTHRERTWGILYVNVVSSFSSSYFTPVYTCNVYTYVCLSVYVRT